MASPQAAVNGVWTELAVNGTGKEYWRTLYDENGQRLVIAALAEI